MTIESRDIIERLESWAQILCDNDMNGTQADIASDLREAIATIKGYRSVAGKAYPTGGLAEIKQSLQPAREQSPSP